MKRIYLDHSATTPLSNDSREAMLPWLDAGNPSSLYQEGRKAKDAIDASRETITDALGCLFAELVFTSGGTEAANLAIVGAAIANEDHRRNRVLLGAAEHHCVLHTQAILEKLGYEVQLVRVGREAGIDLEDLEKRLSENVLLVSTMHANNELGTINPIGEIAKRTQRVGAVLHVDAVQTFLKPEIPWTVQNLEADLVTLSAHKINGPKGVGAVYTRAGVKLKPLVGGGGQEREVRGGTENVAAIAGFGAAVKKVPKAVAPEMRNRLVTGLEGLGAFSTVQQSRTLNGHVHVRFPGIAAQTLLIALDRAGVSASSGAACSSGSVEPSHVLLACGYMAEQAAEGVRFTLGPENTIEDIELALQRLEQVLDRIRSGSRS